MRIYNRKGEKAITLIALIITIIVMLILVMVSVRIALNTGLFDSAGKATKAWKTTQDEEANMKINIAGQEYGSIEDYLETMKGIENKSITVTSSMQEIKFENTIKEYNIASEKKGYTSYEIMGISLAKDGEYITTGSITGKSGNLEIVGDINNTTFKYNLTDIMMGDEVFYCKANIDGEEFVQELKVIQGDVVRYEEDYITFTNSPVGADEIGEWFTIEGEMWSGGTARKIISDYERGKTPDVAAKYEFDFQGSRVDLVFGHEEPAVGNIRNTVKNEDGETVKVELKSFDLSEPGTGIWDLAIDLESNINYSMLGQLAYLTSLDIYNAGYATIIIDAIEVYR